MRKIYWVLLLLFLSACGIIRPTPATPTPVSTHFRSQVNHLEVDLPQGWAASEDGGLIARPFIGLVAFNSWGQEGFWARQGESRTVDGVSYTYSPETVMSQIPKDGAYILLIDFAGGPQMQAEEYGPEHSSQDLHGIWEEQECHATGPFSADFFKWGRLLRLEVYCGAEASEKTVGEVNQLLESWRFDRVPAGDVGWATLVARELLPPEVNPRAFPILTGGPTTSSMHQRDMIWRTSAQILEDGVVAVTFSVRWDAQQTGPVADDCPTESCHWWWYEARPDGEVVLVEEGGAGLPGLSPTLAPSMAPEPAVEPILLPSPEIVFTIVNEEPFSGREGDPKPDWLAWGAQAFTVAPDGSFWIADSAAEPPRLLHFSPTGELLQEVHLEGQVVGLADIAADGDRVWALSIASMPPKVLRFTTEGIYTESYELPEGLRPENGLTGISLAEDGALLVELEGGARLFRLVDENGELDPQPVPSPYPKRWVAPDGSDYIEKYEMDPDPAVQGKRVVRYYSAEGRFLGELELPEPAVYAQHDLALGPDGRLYFMISRADRSVEIWRLGFGGEAFPGDEARPSPSPTPLSPLLPAWETPPPGASDLGLARQALIRFFTFLHFGRFGEAAALYGGSYEDLPVVRDDLPPTSEDKALVWESECALLQCLLISHAVKETQVSPDEYRFVVEFMNEDGTLFVLGPCCGATEAEMPPVWQWLYTVKEVDDQFKVMEPPVYVP